MLYKIRYALYSASIIATMLVLLPFFVIRAGNPKNTKLFFNLFEKVAKYFLNIHVHIENPEYLQNNEPGIVIGNHQHNFDVITVSKLYQSLIVVLGKFELGLIPIFGQFFVLGGNILVKRGNRRKALESMNRLETKVNKKGLKVLVFPEGHRNRKADLAPFKKGAFYTAIKTQSPLIPFSASQFVSLKYPLKGFERLDIYIKVHPPIPVAGKTNKDIPELIAKSREVIQQGINEMNRYYIN